MKKLFIILLSVLLIFSLFSCASDMSDEEARSILSDLVPKSQELNEIFWGEGLKLEDENAEPVLSVSAAQYYRVSGDNAYTKISDIKAAAEQVFSADYLESIYTMLFDGINDENYTVEPRFKDNNDGWLTIDITFSTYELNTEILTETARVVKRGDGIINVEVDCIVNGKNDSMIITLREQNGVWLIDSPTY